MNTLVRRPVVGLAFACIAGSWAGLNYPFHFTALLAAAGALVLMAAVTGLIQRRTARLENAGIRTFTGFLSSLSVYLTFFLLSWLNAGVRGQIPGVKPVASFVDPNNPRVELTGVVADEPYPSSSGEKSCAWKFPVKVETVKGAQDSTSTPSEGIARVTFYGRKSVTPPHYGERWTMKGRLSESAGRQPGMAFQQKRQYFTTSERLSKRESEGNGSWIVQKCLDARDKARGVLALGIEDYQENVAVLYSLLLGYRSQMPNEIYQAFAKTGTLHIFAISGSHVVVLAAIIVFVLSVCGISRIYWVVFLGPLLIFYTIMTGLQPSAIRACIMAVVFWIAPLLHRKPDIYASLAFSAILILVVVPADLRDIGCLLSFVAVLGLVVLYPVFIRPLNRLFVPDPLRLQPEAKRVQLLRKAWKHSSMLLATSAAAWLVSTPLTAYYFGIFSPIALLGNLIAIPLASLIIITGSLSLVLGSCIGFLAEVFNHANLVLAWLLTGIMKLLVAVPGGNFQVNPPPVWWLILCYATMILVAVRFSTRNLAGNSDKCSDAPNP